MVRNQQPVAGQGIAPVAHQFAFPGVFYVASQQQPVAARLNLQDAGIVVARPAVGAGRREEAEGLPLWPAPGLASPAGPAPGQARDPATVIHAPDRQCGQQAGGAGAVVIVGVTDDQGVQLTCAPQAQIGQQHGARHIGAGRIATASVVNQDSVTGLDDHRGTLPHVQDRHTREPRRLRYRGEGRPQVGRQYHRQYQ